jgi:hypothetical protein
MSPETRQSRTYGGHRIVVLQLGETWDAASSMPHPTGASSRRVSRARARKRPWSRPCGLLMRSYRPGELESFQRRAGCWSQHLFAAARNLPLARQPNTDSGHDLSGPRWQSGPHLLLCCSLPSLKWTFDRPLCRSRCGGASTILSSPRARPSRGGALFKDVGDQTAPVPPEARGVRV